MMRNKWRLSYTVWPEVWRSEGTYRDYMYWWQAWTGKTFRILDKYFYNGDTGDYTITNTPEEE